jgi:hypothetical protein
MLLLLWLPSPLLPDVLHIDLLVSCLPICLPCCLPVLLLLLLLPSPLLHVCLTD